MKKTFTLFVLLCVLVLVSCKQKQNHSNTLPSNWSTYNSETIPFRIRQQNLEKGNLIPNHSFESGKIYDIENTPDAFNAPGWRRIGENVYWVNTNEKFYDSTEASDGSHAIKINREKSDETEDAGEGVMSDFIKVIPGKYSLSLDIKLKNIKSSKSRLGTKLYDAIDIRVVYYDKNKIEISPNQYSWHYQTNINSSIKWASFAQFNKIDSLDWTTVYCESAYPPFPDGYVPDETRFVKIFIGLNGSGTMWIDNINYNYSTENFSLKERLEPLYLKELDTYDLILPTPQQITKKNKIQLVSDSIRKKVLITYPRNSAINKSSEFIQLSEKLSKYNPTISTTLANQNIKQYDFILSIGNTDLFNKNFSDSIFNDIRKNQNQGYIITSTEKLQNIVFISSKSEQGLLYGINTAKQLVDSVNNLFYYAEIRDWPELQKRSVTICSEINKNEFQHLFSDLRFNTIFTTNNSPVTSQTNTNGFFLTKPLRQIDNKPNLINRPLIMEKSIETDAEFTFLSNEKILHCDDYDNLEKITQINKDVFNTINHASYYDGIIWRGTSDKSINIDELDLMQFKSFTDIPIVLSLYLNNVPFERNVNANNILSPPVFSISGTIFDQIKSINFEIDSLNLINELKLVSMSCYSWNIGAYKPDEILYKILVKNILKDGDIYKLISLSDKLNILQLKNKNNAAATFNKVEYEELVKNFRFEDKCLDSMVLNNIGLLFDN